MVAAASLIVASLAFHVDASEYAHVVYNVACLAQQVPCTKEKYDRLWKDELRWSTDDEAQLQRWESLVRAAETRSPVEPDAPLLANYLSFFPAIRQRQAILAAALEANSPAAFEARAARIVPPDDARALAGVLRHFQMRLHPWWQRTGRHRVAGLRAIERALSPPIRNLITHAASFVEADSSITDVYMHVVPSPDVSNDDASGTAVRNHFFMELVPPAKTGVDGATEMVVSVGIHELTHALYDSASTATHLRLMRQFVDAPERAAPAMYAFLNEAIATGVQEIAAALVRKARGLGESADDGAGYRHPYIPRLGRAAMAPLEDAFAAGKTITDGFAAAYLRAGRDALAADADSLKFRFAATALLAGDSMGPAVGAFRDAVGPTYTVSTLPEWRRAGELSAVFLLDYNDVRQFADQIPDLASLVTHRGFAFINPYKTRGHVLVLSGRDAAAVVDVVKQLRPSDALPKDGVVVMVD